jgi:hypothetical protein
MRFTEQNKQWLNIWLAFVALGLVMLVGGCTQTVAFLNNVLLYEHITVRQLLLGLIIPHIIMLSGMGVLVGGIIFMVRRAVIQTRLQHPDV